ncbi:hypothetical protein ZH92_004706 [Salmonella enterica subsp. enterica]|nr:hypothetical protein [Salmonella enterica subsp. enterica]MBH0571227.1 hypothetical protein [Salmonella enterica]MBH0644833.1 hypothetical protein [Salmonella enterica]MBH5294809.1 hypothetical protein [Salmonella enterica]
MNGTIMRDTYITNASNVLKSTFGNTKYGRYSKGSIGGSSSSIGGTSSIADVDDDQALTDLVTAQSIMDRKNIMDIVGGLNNSDPTRVIWAQP